MVAGPCLMHYQLRLNSRLSSTDGQPCLPSWVPMKTLGSKQWCSAIGNAAYTFSPIFSGRTQQYLMKTHCERTIKSLALEWFCILSHVPVPLTDLNLYSTKWLNLKVILGLPGLENEGDVRNPKTEVEIHFVICSYWLSMCVHVSC